MLDLSSVYNLLLCVLDLEAGGAWTCWKYEGVCFQDEKIYRSLQSHVCRTTCLWISGV